MKNQLLKAFLITCVCGLMLAGCGQKADNIKPQDADVKTEVSDESAADKTNPDSVTEEGPVVSDNYDGDSHHAIARGPVVLSVVDGGTEDSKALLVSGRTDSWNGANYDCNVFRGNKIRVNANIKSAAKTLRVSIQYDMDGITAYNWIASGTGGTDQYTFVTGTYDIPADVENIYVYVESDSTDDLYIDDFVVKVEGKYVKPAAMQEKVMADISGYASLKDIYQDDFYMGVCINPAVIENEAYAELVKKEFNSVTMENNLKPEAILDKRASLEDLENGGTHFVVNMDAAASELDFAVQNGMKVRGHTLIWHSQTPDWIFYVNYDTNGELADRELMLTRVDHYMKDVFTWADENYPNLFYAWDVVNEAIEDNGEMRDSLWRQTIGDDYLEQVFAIARKYAPEYIKLFYNDYNAFQSTKQNAIIQVLTPIAEAGNLDGVGMQGHLYTGETPEHFVQAATRYTEKLGVVVHITEIDVEEPAAASPEGEQGKYYGQLFRELKKAKANGVPIESVSIWGLTDSLSWKAGNKPLLFHGDLSAKQAFYEIVAAGKNNE
ncbi:MAG: endo-1,4-beta-xylanase [Lachnospiraceae bacterium]